MLLEFLAELFGWLEPEDGNPAERPVRPTNRSRCRGSKARRSAASPRRALTIPYRPALCRSLSRRPRSRSICSANDGSAENPNHVASANRPGRFASRSGTRASHKPLTDAPRTDGIRRDEPEPKMRKTPVKRDFAVAPGTGRDPDLRVRIPLGLHVETRTMCGFLFSARTAIARRKRRRQKIGGGRPLSTLPLSRIRLGGTDAADSNCS
jgi:hypothetical protein